MQRGTPAYRKKQTDLKYYRIQKKTLLRAAFEIASDNAERTELAEIIETSNVLPATHTSQQKTNRKHEA